MCYYLRDISVLNLQCYVIYIKRFKSKYNYYKNIFETKYFLLLVKNALIYMKTYISYVLYVYVMGVADWPRQVALLGNNVRR